MNVWKIASRWSDTGTEDSSIIDIFRKYNIVFAGRQTDYIKQSVEVGDYIAVTDGTTIVSVGIVLGEPAPITDFEFEEKDINDERFDYEDWVIGFKVIIFDLDKNNFIKINRGSTFHSINDNKVKQKIIITIEEKYFIPSEDKFISSPLPYAIKQFEIDNYQGIKKLHIKNIPTDTQWIFFTGENGFGKTSVLQSLVIGLFGAEAEDKKPLDKRESIRTKIEFKDNNENQINILHNKFKKFTKFAAYGPARLNKQARTNFPFKTHNLFNSYGELLDIEDKMIMWEGSETQRKYFDATRQILFKLMKPYITDIHVERIGSKTDVIYFERDSNEPKPFLELASGFRSIIAMIGDMIIRLSEEQPEIENFEELAGIVIIDELDLHLHPKMQRELVERLTDIFKNIQFIVSTHSPIPLLGALPERTVILNVTRTKEEGITVRRLEKLEKELKYLLPNQLLTSDIFELEEIENVYLDDNELDKVAVEDKYDDIEENKKMMQELEELAKNKELFPDDLFKTKTL